MATRRSRAGETELAPTVVTRTRDLLVPLEPMGRLLAPAEPIVSPETGLTYRIERPLGEGGFGRAYLAKRLGRSATVPESVCINISPRLDGWLREAYFGQLLGTSTGSTPGTSPGSGPGS